MIYQTTLIKRLTFFVLLFISSGCQSTNSEQHDLSFLLKTSFNQVYLAKYGLDYPRTKESLTRCIQYNDTKCLDAYEQVLNGKKKIKSIASRRGVLKLTLDIIEKTCISENEEEANFTCYGGIMSLYFYSTLEQDLDITERLKIYPKKIRNIIFNNEFFWYYNRPNANAWIEYLSNADIDWKYDVQQEFISKLFNASISELDEKPWVLQ